MKILFLIIALSITLLGMEKPQPLLDSISQHAIRIGDGKVNNVYVFIDPLCRYSKKYIKELILDDELLKENSYYIFLYRLPKFASDRIIQYIYQSEDPLTLLEDMMIYEEEIDFDGFSVSKKTMKIIDDVAVVGKKIEANIRPYIITLPASAVPSE
ncbi:MAG: hypothetical protein ABFQ64_03535 [Campylobacterota bacterium]